MAGDGRLRGMAVVSTASVTPTPPPLCDEPTCIVCHVKQERGESRQHFLGRLRGMFLMGRLSVGGK